MVQKSSVDLCKSYGFIRVMRLNPLQSLDVKASEGAFATLQLKPVLAGAMHHQQWRKRIDRRLFQYALRIHSSFPCLASQSRRVGALPLTHARSSEHTEPCLLRAGKPCPQVLSTRAGTLARAPKGLR